MIKSWASGVALLLLLALGACKPATQAIDDMAPPKFDGGSGPMFENAAGCRGLFCDAQNPCPGGRRCVQSVCFPDQGSCTRDNECIDDSRCYLGACVPFSACSKLLPYDPNCRGAAFKPDEYRNPVEVCHYDGVNSLSLPVVADLDKDGKPEIITIVYTNSILALHGDCTKMWQVNQPLLSNGQGSLAVADLDGDGYPEIVAVDDMQQVIVLDHNGKLLATSPTPAQEKKLYERGDLWSAPAIVDVDGKAPPEIVYAGQVSRYVAGTPGKIEVLWTHPNLAAFWGSLSVAADLDGDGTPEVITSDAVYDGLSGKDKTPPDLFPYKDGAMKMMPANPPFYPQVADFNQDGNPDLLLIHPNKGAQMIVRIYDYKNRTPILEQMVLEGTWGGPAVIADFDGDKVPDFGLATAQRYYVFALKCLKSPKPADCKGPDAGVLWSKETEDASSGGTASSVFDFNGDGLAEVVYRDECWLRVYNGPDGKTLFASNITSSTALEYPVIADINADGHADIVVTSDKYEHCTQKGQPEQDTGVPWKGFSQGIYVLSDPMNRWMPSRTVWNQHSYHITNINDDLSVPVRENNNWLNYNNYRQNTQTSITMTGAQPDLTAHAVAVLDSNMCDKSWHLQGNVCNRGTVDVAAPVYATFYDGDPDKGGKRICTIQTTHVLKPGTCEMLGCDWTSPPQQQSRDLWLRAGDDGMGNRFAGECKDGNNTSEMKGASCSAGPG